LNNAAWVYDDGSLCPTVDANGRPVCADNRVAVTSWDGRVLHEQPDISLERIVDTPLIITGITVEQFRLAVARVGMRRYGDNLRVEIEREFSQTRFNARVLPIVTGSQMGLPPGELAPGEKRTWQGWFSNALCWHAEHDVLIEIFNINPNAKVRTMYANYLGAEVFLREHPRTARINVGPTAKPVMPVECCDCEAPFGNTREEQEMIEWWAEQGKRALARHTDN
jgi:hypothetical protein